jgi:hypothetical protein
MLCAPNVPLLLLAHVPAPAHGGQHIRAPVRYQQRRGRRRCGSGSGVLEALLESRISNFLVSFLRGVEGIKEEKEGVVIVTAIQHRYG